MIGQSSVSARNMNSCYLFTQCGGSVRHIMRVVIGQACCSQVLRNTQGPEKLHAARRDVIALDIRQGLCRPQFNQVAGDTALGQGQGHGHANWATTHYEHGLINLGGRIHQGIFNASYSNSQS
jgi:hypothetical protein